MDIDSTLDLAIRIIDHCRKNFTFNDALEMSSEYDMAMNILKKRESDKVVKSRVTVCQCTLCGADYEEYREECEMCNSGKCIHVDPVRETWTEYQVMTVDTIKSDPHYERFNRNTIEECVNNNDKYIKGSLVYYSNEKQNPCEINKIGRLISVFKHDGQTLFSVDNGNYIGRYRYITVIS